MKKAVVFDLDGTLSDSLVSIAYCANRALEAFGLTTFENDRYKYFVGDGAAELIRRTVAVAAEYGTAVPAVAPVDSFRSTEGVASHPVDRSMLRAVQTPQVFRARLLRDAYETLFSPDFTDDASVVERFGATIRLCDGERRNIKITAREDLLFAEALLADDADRAAAEAACPRDEAAMSDRTEAGIPAGRDAAAPEAAK